MICVSVQSVFHLLHLLSDSYHDIQCRPCMLPCNMQGQHWVSWYESDRAWFVSPFSQWIVSTCRGTPYRGTLPVTLTKNCNKFVLCFAVIMCQNICIQSGKQCRP